jgi:hypothetical protein
LTGARALKLKAELTYSDGKIKTFGDAASKLVRFYIGPVFASETDENKVEEYIRNMKELTPWLTYFSGESMSGEEGKVGMYYIVHREDASFPRDHWFRKPKAP